MIPTKYYIPPFLKPLAEIESELPVLLELESITDESLNSRLNGLYRIKFRDDALQVWGQTHINAAFSHRRLEGNRFKTVDFGAWYASYDDLTSIDEVSYHRTRELVAVNFFEDEVIYQALLAQISGEFRDLRQADSEEPFLGKNPETAIPSPLVDVYNLPGSLIGS